MQKAYSNTFYGADTLVGKGWGSKKTVNDHVVHKENI